MAMDAGMAAVLGATAGALATTGAAIATGWASREQAKIAARAEHRRQRREPRQEIYKRFIGAANNAEWHFAALPLLIAAFDRDELEAQERIGRFSEMTDSIQETWLDVVLAGPAEIAQTASAIKDACQSLTICAHAFSEGGHAKSILERDARAFSKELSESLARFIAQARDALDDDGSRRHR
ncbi:hypothetical protein [Streptomyces sp. 8N706]|uniref:hypothetical protein n=1 Tax=Streptomyces sp. 8N706 TaxID=3457416 RepID=UPI003FD49E75